VQAHGFNVGFCVGGTLVGGTLVAGTSVGGIAVGGTSVAGTLVLGISVQTSCALTGTTIFNDIQTRMKAINRTKIAIIGMDLRRLIII